MYQVRCLGSINGLNQKGDLQRSTSVIISAILAKAYGHWGKNVFKEEPVTLFKRTR